jgi:hypothetical protein
MVDADWDESLILPVDVPDPSNVQWTLSVGPYHLSSALRSARLPVNLIGSPINYANRLIGSPITSQSTAPL